MAAVDAYDFCAKEGPQAIEAARMALAETDRAKSDDVLRKLAQIVIDLRLNGQTITQQTVADEAKKDESLSKTIPALLLTL